MMDTESGLTSDTDFSLTDVSQLDVNSSHQMVCLYREYSSVCRTATSIIKIEFELLCINTDCCLSVLIISQIVLL